MKETEVKPVILTSDKTGKEFKFASRCEAAKFLGVDYSYLKPYLKKGYGHLKKKGYRIELLPQETVTTNANALF